MYVNSCSERIGYKTFIKFGRNRRKCKENYFEEGSWYKIIEGRIENEIISMWEIWWIIEEIKIRFTKTSRIMR